MINPDTHRTTHELVDSLTQDQARDLLIECLFTLQSIAHDDSHSQLGGRPSERAGSVLGGHGWYGNGFRKTVRLGDLTPGTPFRVVSESGVTWNYKVVGPSKMNHHIEVINTDDGGRSNFMIDSRVHEA